MLPDEKEAQSLIVQIGQENQRKTKSSEGQENQMVENG